MSQSVSLNIDTDLRWTPCTVSWCVWLVLTDDGIPVPCGSCWDGRHHVACRREQVGQCTCHAAN